MILVDKRYEIIPRDFNFAGQASSDIKRTLKNMRFSRDFIKRVSVAAYESEINIVIHSLGGRAAFKITEAKLYLEFTDYGPGIPDIALAMTPGYSTASEESRLNGFGAGMGFTNILKSVDRFDILSDPNGTVLKLVFDIGEADRDAGL
ncbi:MAG: hypothetical protein WC509_08400 [Candidatus Izemoplasmatales bacterium]